MKDFKQKIVREVGLLLKDTDFSGSILVAQEGGIFLNRSFGMANYELAVANSSKTKYRIGSITKLFTATAIMQLVEKKTESLIWISQ